MAPRAPSINLYLGGGLQPIPQLHAAWEVRAVSFRVVQRPQGNISITYHNSQCTISAIISRPYELSREPLARDEGGRVAAIFFDWGLGSWQLEWGVGIIVPCQLTR
jgi:hypothetical protein